MSVSFFEKQISFLYCVVLFRFRLFVFLFVVFGFSRWAKKTDYTITASELFRTAVRDQFRGGKDCDDRGIIEGESVAAEKSGSSLAAVIGGSGGAGGGGGGGGSGARGGDFKASLFDLAVLSGDKDAVCWAASFVRGNAGSPCEVRARTRPPSITYSVCLVRQCRPTSEKYAAGIYVM